MSARILMVGLACWLIAGCDRLQTSNQPPQPANQKIPTAAIKVVFLTREGCSGSSTMLENLKQAASHLETGVDCEVIDQGALPSFDPRTGYPTPTILYKNRDLFGMSEPSPPLPEPM